MRNAKRVIGALIVLGTCAAGWAQQPEGTLELLIEGQPPRMLKAGESFFVPAGVVHDGRNIGSGPLKVLATYVVETGKAVATPGK